LPGMRASLMPFREVMTFTDAEHDYLQSQRLARIATVSDTDFHGSYFG